jgi:hypothetical protein
MPEKKPCLLVIIFFVFSLIACTTQAITQVPSQAVLQPTNTSQPEIVPTDTPPPVSELTNSCENWQSWPVLPLVSNTARDLYRYGQSDGNDPHAFSKVGDGEVSAAWFLTMFDLGKDTYDLGSYQNLAPVIENFPGSFGRIGMAARRGFNTDRILDPSLRNAEQCEAGESPLTCELRLHRPAFAFLSLGTNQVWQPKEFEKGMRQILEILLSKHIIPILSTKGDNLEGDGRINRTIACLAQKYDLPLWNFWSAIQPLPHHGLQPDLEHLTYGITDFSDTHAMQSAWAVRNLTALQVLDVVWRGVTAQP